MIVRLNGGLGNQMFQYAFGRSVSKIRGEDLFFVKVGLDRGYHRAYSLGAFNVEAKFTGGVSGPVYDERTFAYDPGVFAAPTGSYYCGCWQTEKYFNEALVRKELSFKNPMSQQTEQVAEKIRSRTSAFIHVRRTDYLYPATAAYHGNMGMDYYEKAMAYVRERVPNVHFFVFSDEPQWCRGAFQGDAFTIVGHNGMGDGSRGPSTEHEDLYLMSLCGHAIIPNSSFGWWGAWLNPEKQRVVVAPERWFAGANLDTKDLIPPHWSRL